MIGKDYFKRQASTLRKMVEVARDRTVAERLIHLADGFEAKAGQPGEPSVNSVNNPGDQPPAASRGGEGDSGR